MRSRQFHQIVHLKQRGHSQEAGSSSVPKLCLHKCVGSGAIQSRQISSIRTTNKLNVKIQKLSAGNSLGSSPGSGPP